MKVLIDIDDKLYNKLADERAYVNYASVGYALGNYVREGIAVETGDSNLDVLTSIFNCEVDTYHTDIRRDNFVDLVMHTKDGKVFHSLVTREWANENLEVNR